MCATFYLLLFLSLVRFCACRDLAWDYCCPWSGSLPGLARENCDPLTRAFSNGDYLGDYGNFEHSNDPKYNRKSKEIGITVPYTKLY